jgi:prepilin-type N-terminal cleavage/methylation domain-containing protein
MLTRPSAQRSVTKAFTLLELIVVIVILGILAALAIPTFSRVVKRSQDASTRTTLAATLRSARALMTFGDTDWGSAAGTTASETPYLASGLSAAGTLTGLPTTRDPELGELTYHVAPDDQGKPLTLVMALRSQSGGVCVGSTTLSSSSSVACDEVSATSAVTRHLAGALGTPAGGAASAPPSSPGAATAPGRPTSVTASVLDSTASVSWSAPASDGGAPLEDYVVTVRPSSGTTWTLPTPGPVTTLSVPGLVAGTSYTFTVVARNSVTASGASTPSNSITATVAAPAPQPVSVDAVTTSSVTIPIAAVAGATSYDLRYSGDTGGTWSEVNAIPAAQSGVTIAGLDPATRYVYEVRSSDGANTSAWSEPATFTTAAPDAPKVIYTSRFFDSFTETKVTNLNNRLTEDKSSNWQVWLGRMWVDTKYGAVYGELNWRNVGVVRTSAHDATILARDLDGEEAVVLRGSDKDNFILVGGTGSTGSFAITKVENGVYTTLMTAALPENSDVRVVARGSTISAYRVWAAGPAATPFATATTTFNLTDPGATYFGVSITNNGMGYGVTDFTFDKL